MKLGQVTDFIQTNQHLIKKRQVRSEHTWNNYRKIERMLIRYFGESDVSMIRTVDYKAFHDWLATRETDPTTTNNYRRWTRAMWNWMPPLGKAVCDIRGITQFLDEGHEEPKDISAEQLQLLLRRASLRDRAMFLYISRGGFRKQTLPRLTTSNTHIWQNKDGEYRIASHIPREKQSLPRLVFAGHDAALTVKCWLDTREFESEFLFTVEDGSSPLAYGTLKSIWRKNVQRAQLADTLRGSAWHRFRRQYAQDKLREGHDCVILGKWMGISPLMVMKIYGSRSNLSSAKEFYAEDMPSVVEDFFKRSSR